MDRKGKFAFLYYTLYYIFTNYSCALFKQTEFGFNMKTKTNFDVVASHQSTLSCWHQITLIIPHSIKYGPSFIGGKMENSFSCFLYSVSKNSSNRITLHVFHEICTILFFRSYYPSNLIIWHDDADIYEKLGKTARKRKLFSFSWFRNMYVTLYLACDTSLRVYIKLLSWNKVPINVT